MSGPATAVPVRVSTGSATLPIMVNESLLAVDKVTGANAPAANLLEPMRPRSTADLSLLRDMVLRARRTAPVPPRAHLVAIGTTPIADPDMGGAGSALTRPVSRPLTMRVAVPDARLAVPVCRRLEAWLPVLLALTANSPVCLGIDTGYASWQFVQSRRRTLGALLPRRRTGTALELASEVRAAEAWFSTAMLPWHARPSIGRPAVDVRVGDVPLSADDTVVVAGLLRAAVATAAREVGRGRPAPRLDVSLLRAAHWEAARDGMAGRLMNPSLNRLRPAWQVLEELVARVSPALLAAGDLDLVVDGLIRTRAAGVGADRQRDIYRRAGGILPGLPALAKLTTEA